MPRILVIDGNEAATRARHVSVGGTDSGDGYAATLKRLQKDIECDIVRAADGDPKLPDGVALADYHGAVITGSALNVYSREAAVERQIDLAKAVFAAGVPCFGSCWGLQVGVTAAGGSVVRNPRGREFGFGAAHHADGTGPRSRACSRASPRCSRPAPCMWTPWRACRPVPHRWRTTTWACRRPRSSSRTATFWGVQYHPEYSAAEIAAMARRYGEVLIRDGLVKARPSSTR